MKHHYVPTFYLRGFTDASTPAGQEPYLWVVDVSDGRIRRRAPENSAALTDYYAVGDGEDRHAVEGYLAVVEGIAAPLVSRILDDGFLDGPDLNAADKAAMSRLVAAQVARVPQFRDRIQDFMTGIGQAIGGLMLQSRDHYERVLREAHPDREFTATEIEELYRGAVALVPSITATSTAALGHAVNVIPAVAHLLQQMAWAITTPSSPTNFWTSDNPVYWINPDSSHPVFGHGLAARGTEVNFPLGPQRCLLLNCSGREGKFFVRDARIGQQRAIYAASRYLFCSSEDDAKQALDVYRRLHPLAGGKPPEGSA